MAMKVAVFPTPEAVAGAVADIICATVHNAIQEKGYCTISLAGGRTPNLLYELLALPDYGGILPWQQMLFFWGDERYVPPSHKDSNYGAAETRLFSKVPIPSANVFSMNTAHPDPTKAATLYEQTIRQVFHTRGCFGFDLTLLGMGTDGHTASLFPGSLALREKEKWVTTVVSPGGQQRLTITIPLINASETILFLVTGHEKQDMLTAVMADHRRGAVQYPAAMVQGRKQTLWFVDQYAYQAVDDGTD